MAITTPEDDLAAPHALALEAGLTLSVIMPVFNEEGAIEGAVREVRDEVFGVVPAAELVVVDDGSRDRTGVILEELARLDARIRVIHKVNGGHGSALRAGLDAAVGEWFFLIDSDRQIPMSAFPAFWEAARTRDGGFGVRTKRNDPRVRVWLSTIIATLLRPLLGVAILDANVPFKVVRRGVWLAAEPMIPAETLAPSLFLAVYMVKAGYDVAEVSVPHKERESGMVSIRRWRLLKFCVRGFGQLLAFRSRLARATRTAKAMRTG